MSRILLVDDSPHAQRIGERILIDEGFEVVTVSNAESALIRLDDAQPDVVVCKAVLPGRTGYEICQFVRMSPRHRHVRVVLTAGATETLNEAEVRESGAHGTLKKPFEATALIETVRPLAEAAEKDKGSPTAPAAAAAPRPAEARVTAPVIAVIDPEQVRAAVTIALDAAMPALIDELTNRVLGALSPRRQPDASAQAAPPATPAGPGDVAPLPTADPVRQVTRASSGFAGAPNRPLHRQRPGTVLGLSFEPETPAPDPGSPDRS